MKSVDGVGVFVCLCVTGEETILSNNDHFKNVPSVDLWSGFWLVHSRTLSYDDMWSLPCGNSSLADFAAVIQRLRHFFFFYLYFLKSQICFHGFHNKTDTASVPDAVCVFNLQSLVTSWWDTDELDSTQYVTNRSGDDISSWLFCTLNVCLYPFEEIWNPSYTHCCSTVTREKVISSFIGSGTTQLYKFLCPLMWPICTPNIYASCMKIFIVTLWV